MSPSRLHGRAYDDDTQAATTTSWHAVHPHDPVGLRRRRGGAEERARRG